MCNDYEQHVAWAEYRRMMSSLALKIPSLQTELDLPPADDIRINGSISGPRGDNSQTASAALYRPQLSSDLPERSTRRETSLYAQRLPVHRDSRSLARGGRQQAAVLLSRIESYPELSDRIRIHLDRSTLGHFVSNALIDTAARPARRLHQGRSELTKNSGIPAHAVSPWNRVPLAAL